MQGFFEVKPQKVSKRLSCVTCGLYHNSTNPKLEPSGEFQKKILCIGDFPDELDDHKKKSFTGDKGHLLRRLLQNLDIDLEVDCACINAVACRTEEKKDPTSKQIACCRTKVFQVINELKPKLILLFGSCAVSSLIDHRWHDEKTPSLDQLRGFVIPDRDTKCWVMATYNLDFVNESDVEVKTIVKQDLAKAIKHLDKKFPVFVDEATQVEIVEDTSFLKDLKGPVAWDVEATGLKPNNTKIHKIICMSVSAANDKAYSFMMPTKGQQLQNVKDFLKSDIEKIAANLKYETNWAKNILKTTVRKWIWDTMLATHVLDNRRGITGLKFSSFVKFGITDYNSHIAPFLKAKDNKNGNAVNQIETLIKTEKGKRDLLIYCGVDSILERRLALLQMKELGYER